MTSMISLIQIKLYRVIIPQNIGIDKWIFKTLQILSQIINIHPPSGWFFTCGHSPRFFAMRKRIYTNCQLRGDCYLPPVNGPTSLIVSCSPNISSFSWLAMYSAIRLSFFPTVSIRTWKSSRREDGCFLCRTSQSPL